MEPRECSDFECGEYPLMLAELLGYDRNQHGIALSRSVYAGLRAVWLVRRMGVAWWACLFLTLLRCDFGFAKIEFRMMSYPLIKRRHNATPVHLNC